jgi:hypothetical protein
MHRNAQLTFYKAVPQNNQTQRRSQRAKKHKRMNPLHSILGLFWWDWGLNSGLHTCKVVAVLLEPCLHPRSFWRYSKGVVSATIPNVKFLTSASLQNKIVVLMKPQRALNKTLIIIQIFYFCLKGFKVWWKLIEFMLQS